MNQKLVITNPKPFFYERKTGLLPILKPVFMNPKTDFYVSETTFL